MNIFNDPRIFTYVIMALYTGSIIRFACARMWPDALYWFFALGLTVVVTFLKK
jgi:hypothetical protein